MTTPAKVLLVDDEPHILSSLRRLLRGEPYSVSATSSPTEALELLGQGDFAAVMTDQRMPGMLGVQLLEKTAAVAPDTVRLILTGHTDLDVAIDAINRGAVYRFLTKPWEDEHVRQALAQAVGLYQLGRDNERLQKLTLQQNQKLGSLNQELLEARQQEVSIGTRIQQALLQSPLDLPPDTPCEAAALTIASQQIDGDFYDLFSHDSQCLDLVVGDVMGKGVPAALLGAGAKTQLLRALATLKSSGLPQPEAVVAEIHRQLTPELIELESFVTLCYARIDLARNLLIYVDCGHTSVLHYRRARGSCVGLKGDNLPLGFQLEESYQQSTAPLGPGDVLLFYSDGVTEAADGAGDLYGDERLERCLERHAELSPASVVHSIRHEVVGFCAAEHFTDDLTCLAVAIDAGVRSVELARGLDDLAALRSSLAAYARRQWGDEVDEERLEALQLAANEAYVNIVEHAHESPEKALVVLEMRRRGSQGLFRLVHWGTDFDPDAPPPPSFDGSRDRGFGVYIIENSVDSVRYDQCGVARLVELTQTLSRGAEHGRDSN